MSLGRLLAAGKSLMGIKEKSGRYQMRPAALLPKFVSDKNPFRDGPRADDNGKSEPQKAEARKPQPAGRGRAHVASAGESVSDRAKPQMPRPRTAREITPSLFDPVAPEREPVIPNTPEPKHVCDPVGVSTGPGEIALEPTPESRGLESQPAAAAGPRPQTSPSKNVEAHVTRPLPSPAKPRVSFGTRLKKLNPFTYLFARQPAAAARPRRERLPEQTELSLERVIPVRNDLSDADLEIRTARPAKSVKALKVEKANEPAARANEPVLAGPAEETTAWSRLSSRWFGAGQTTHAHTH